MSSPKKTKKALVGAGGWAGHHARIFSAHPDVEFYAIAGRNEKHVRRRAEEFKVRAYTDIPEMLEREKPELVSVCLPNQHHFEATLQVIRAGCPLLVEKPLVFDLKEADQLLLEAENRNLFFAINFNHRYAKPVQMAREAIAGNQLGEIVFGTWRFGGEGESSHPYGNLIETQCHGFDMLEFLCGPITSISAEMTDKTGRGHTTLALALRFASGAVGSLLGTYDSSYAYPGTHLLEINGTLGRIVVEDTVRRYQFQKMGCEISEVWQAGYFNDRDRGFQNTFDTHVDRLLEAFRRGNPPPIHAHAGRRTLVLALAAIESFERGCRVNVPA